MGSRLLKLSIIINSRDFHYISDERPFSNPNCSSAMNTVQVNEISSTSEPDYVYNNGTPTGSKLYVGPPVVRPLIQLNPPPLVETRDAARDAANAAFERDFDWIIDDPVEARRLIERVRARLNNKLYCYIIFHVLSIKACNLLRKTFIISLHTNILLA